MLGYAYKVYCPSLQAAGQQRKDPLGGALKEMNSKVSYIVL